MSSTGGPSREVRPKSFGCLTSHRPCRSGSVVVTSDPAPWRRGRPSASRQRSGQIRSTFLGAPPHDNLPAEQGLKAEGRSTNGQGPLAYPYSSEALNRHGERHVLRMATW